jgi:hypothetical protein
MGIVDQLRQLQEQRRAGSITEEEFRRSKSILLGRRPRAEEARGGDDDAVLQFLWDTWGGALMTFEVRLNDELAGTLNYQETLCVPAPPGPCELRVSGGGAFFAARLELDLAANEILTWKVGYTWLGGVRLTLV